VNVLNNEYYFSFVFIHFLAASAFASSYLYFSASKSLVIGVSGISYKLVLPYGPSELILPFYGPL